MSERARALHAANQLGVVYVTGGASTFLSELLGTPGASRTVLEARVPYAFEVLSELLGGAPDQACSEPTARALAMAAFTRARQINPRAVFGLACTASLATDRKKRGAHRAHLALQTISHTASVSIELDGTRIEEERIVVDNLWALCQPLQGGHYPDGSQVVEGPSDWRALVEGNIVAVSESKNEPKLLLPGSFNPMHAGHQRMLEVAEQRLGCPAGVEIAIENVDKPLLDYQSMQRRRQSIRELGDWPIWFTRLPTFVQKAERFTNCVFAVGLDTVVRIGDPKYYEDGDLPDAIARLADAGARFLVFGRQLGDSQRFTTLADVALPKDLAALCDGVEADDFRMDISSSAIRASQAAD